MRSKVFGIGLSKTGTQSLNRALELLGYTAIHHPTKMEQFEAFEAATDAPVAAKFEMLDRRFPGSQFVYTRRDLSSWLDSFERHLRRRPLKGGRGDLVLGRHSQSLYDSVEFDRRLFAEAYQRHERRVLRYFAHRPGDLVTLDICNGSPGWTPLCSFLGVPEPAVDFPSVNNTTAIDALFRYLMLTFEDPEKVADLTQVSLKYLGSLRVEASMQRPDCLQLIMQDDGNRIDKILKTLCQRLGGVEAAVATLELPEARLRQALKWKQRRHKAQEATASARRSADQG